MKFNMTVEDWKRVSEELIKATDGMDDKQIEEFTSEFFRILHAVEGGINKMIKSGIITDPRQAHSADPREAKPL